MGMSGNRLMLTDFHSHPASNEYLAEWEVVDGVLHMKAPVTLKARKPATLVQFTAFDGRFFHMPISRLTSGPTISSIHTDTKLDLPAGAYGSDGRVTPEPEEEAKKDWIWDMEFSTRTGNVLRAMGVDTPEKFLALERTDVMDQPNAGRKTWNEVEEMQRYMRKDSGWYEERLLLAASEWNSLVLNLPRTMLVQIDPETKLLSIYRRLT